MSLSYRYCHDFADFVDIRRQVRVGEAAIGRGVYLFMAELRNQLRSLYQLTPGYHLAGHYVMDAVAPCCFLAE